MPSSVTPQVVAADRGHREGRWSAEMIQLQTFLNAADNSGARTLQCIKCWAGRSARYATVGDVIKVSVKDAIPRGKVRRVRCMTLLSFARSMVYVVRTDR